MKCHTPLRYPGGKTKLAGFIGRVLQSNRLEGCAFVEPYAGGGGISVALLLEGHVSRIVINDLDYVVYAFWKTLVDDAEWLCQKVLATPVTLESYYAQKTINRAPEKYPLREVGFSTFFLNRTNRSGILRAGVIGGYRQDGSYKMDSRYNKAVLVEKIRKIAAKRDAIHVFNDDAIALTEKLTCLAGKKVLFYFDPPYVNKADSLYNYSYVEGDHLKLAQMLQDLEWPWIASYDDVPAIRELYRSCASSELHFNYSVYHSGVRGKELLLYGNLLLPDGAHPLTPRPARKGASHDRCAPACQSPHQKSQQGRTA